MRVLIVSQWYPPEPDHLVSGLAEALQAHGQEVTVLTGLPNYPSGDLYPGYRLCWRQREIIRGIPVVRVPLYPDHGRSGLKRAANYISFSLAAASIGPWLVERPDVIHAYHPPLTIGLPAWTLSRVLRAPFTMEIQDMWPETLSATGMLMHRAPLAAVGWCAKRLYRQAAAIRVISTGFRDNLIAKGVPAEKIRVVSNWIDTEANRPVPADPQQAERLALAGRFNVMYAGNMGPAQDIDTLLEAAARLTDVPQMQLVLVGDGVDLARLRATAQQRGLANVRFLGRVPGEEMPGLYALADVLLVHLRDDPLFRITVPHKIFSYMASQKPVLGAVAGDAAELIESSNAGMICAPGQPAALAEMIRRFVGLTRVERERLGENGRRTVCESFGRDCFVKQMTDMFEAVVERSHSVRRRGDAGLLT